MRTFLIMVLLVSFSVKNFADGKVIPRKFEELDETESFQRRKGATKRPRPEVPSSKETFLSPDVKELGSTSKLEDSRPKRSFYPFQNNYQQQWPQTEYTNTWVSTLFPLQKPFYVSVSSYSGSVSNYNLEYTYFDTTEPQPRRTPSNSDTKSMRTMLRPRSSSFAKEKLEKERPIWDVSRYQPKFSKTSKRELFQGDGASFLGDKEDSGRIIFLDRGQLEDNDILSFSFTKSEPARPSRCSWAILSCCSTSNDHVNLECFKEMSCEGPFWGVKVCSVDYQRAAIQAASDFFETGEN